MEETQSVKKEKSECSFCNKKHAPESRTLKDHADWKEKGKVFKIKK